jgi:hypothetical protein
MPGRDSLWFLVSTKLIVCNAGLFKTWTKMALVKKKIMNQLKPIQRQTNLIIQNCT